MIGKKLHITKLLKTLLLLSVVCDVTSVSFPVQERVSTRNIYQQSISSQKQYTSYHYVPSRFIKFLCFRKCVFKMMLATKRIQSQLKLFSQNWEYGSCQITDSVLLEGTSKEWFCPKTQLHRKMQSRPLLFGTCRAQNWQVQ